MTRNFAIGLLASAGLLVLSACGGGGSGGGGSGIVSTPPPPTPTPDPTPTPTVTFKAFDAPTTQQFAVENSPMSSKNIALRYDAPTNSYDIQLDGEPWQPVTDTPTAEYGNFVESGEMATLTTLAPDGYLFSRFASWWGVGGYGSAAVGEATPAGAVPVTGSATYNGFINGATDAFPSNACWYIGVGGPLEMNVDFASGSLSGKITPTLSYVTIDWTTASQALAPIGFVDTVHGVGSTGFSGRFDTALAGDNAFSGTFTGPAAEEFIGKWSFPFLLTSNPDTGFVGDNQVHQAGGVMVGKR